LIHIEDGNVVFSFSRRPLLGSATSPRSKDIPDLSDKQVEALNLIQLLAEEDALIIDLEPGDLLFWNNLGLLHARNGFTDSQSRRRHLVRIWLHNDDLGWAIPQQIRQPWKDAFEHDGRQQLWPLEPITDRSYITTQQRSSGHS
jgi:Taurine catabolism dioxygenase TauD, TfdA family